MLDALASCSSQPTQPRPARPRPPRYSRDSPRPATHDRKPTPPDTNHQQNVERVILGHYHSMDPRCHARMLCFRVGDIASHVLTHAARCARSYSRLVFTYACWKRELDETKSTLDVCV